ncbi:hypothetical protein NECAME_03125 [Necator americanus]|uniref:Uncharacterized protein n=1 Tax=Necator americanus TaxID=51031 RepID=W2T9N2_NECAM|nr:hypothetical protein NECAME_03125 [Necator americanus]ETN77707.1 hypothetical protein NECAME_03125 [Necator americanus]
MSMAKNIDSFEQITIRIGHSFQTCPIIELSGKRQQTSDTTLELHPFYGIHYEDVAAMIGGGQPK